MKTYISMLLCFAGMLCPDISAQQTIRIMPLGDSITQGLIGPDHYRQYLWNKLHQSGVTSIDFVGSHTALQGPVDDPRTGYDEHHEGHSGWHVNHLLYGGGWNQGGSGNLDTWLTSLRTQGKLPDIVLLHIGTNDVLWEAPNDAGTINEIKAVINKLRAYNASVQVLVAKLIPHKDSSKRSVNALNALIPGLASYDTASSDVRVVDMHTGFSTAWLADNYHPNGTGGQWMADRWRDALLQPGLLVAPRGAITAKRIDPETGTATLSFRAEAGRRYAVESSSNHTTWTRVKTVVAASNAPEVDVALSDDGLIFRLVSLPN